MGERTIDARGLECPKPVLATREALAEEGLTKLTVIVDNQPAAENVRRLASGAGWNAVAEAEGDDYNVVLTGGPVLSGAAAPQGGSSGGAGGGAGGGVVAFIPSQYLGEGDDKLGAILMRAFIKTLREVDPLPAQIIFINSGVKLTSEGSELIDDVKSLETMGAAVLSCGTCLDFYGLKDKLQVGVVSNMFEIASALAGASHVVRT